MFMNLETYQRSKNYHTMRHDPNCKLCHGLGDIVLDPEELADLICNLTNNHKAQVEIYFDWLKSLSLRNVEDKEERAALLLAWERIRINTIDKGKTVGIIPCDFD